MRSGRASGRTQAVLRCVPAPPLSWNRTGARDRSHRETGLVTTTIPLFICALHACACRLLREWRVRSVCYHRLVSNFRVTGCLPRASRDRSFYACTRIIQCALYVRTRPLLCALELCFLFRLIISCVWTFSYFFSFKTSLYFSCLACFSTFFTRC